MFRFLTPLDDHPHRVKTLLSLMAYTQRCGRVRPLPKLPRYLCTARDADYLLVGTCSAGKSQS